MVFGVTRVCFRWNHAICLRLSVLIVWRMHVIVVVYVRSMIHSILVIFLIMLKLNTQATFFPDKSRSIRNGWRWWWWRWNRCCELRSNMNFFRFEINWFRQLFFFFLSMEFRWHTLLNFGQNLDEIIIILFWLRVFLLVAVVVITIRISLFEEIRIIEKIFSFLMINFVSVRFQAFANTTSFLSIILDHFLTKMMKMSLSLLIVSLLVLFWLLRNSFSMKILEIVFHIIIL